MKPRFIYRNLADARFYASSKGEMRGGPDKVIVYIDGLLVAMDRDAKIIIPVSRWKLVEIGLACFLAALKGTGAAPRSLKVMPVPESTPALPEPAEEQLAEPADEHLLRGLDDQTASPEASHPESSEAQWERLIGEMRDLAQR